MDRVVYDGRSYFRYPNSKSRSYRLYYRRQRYNKTTGKRETELLHRTIWEKRHGKVPYDHLIHHKDGNSSNNALPNLECIPIRDHLITFHGADKYRNAPEKKCFRCQKVFKAKTKRSFFCADCVSFFFYHHDESVKWKGLLPL
jgi:hypothetical protein